MYFFKTIFKNLTACPQSIDKLFLALLFTSHFIQLQLFRYDLLFPDDQELLYTTILKSLQHQERRFHFFRYGQVAKHSKTMSQKMRLTAVNANLYRLKKENFVLKRFFNFHSTKIEIADFKNAV